MLRLLLFLSVDNLFDVPESVPYPFQPLSTPCNAMQATESLRT